MKLIRFSDLRDDWYRGADLMARYIARGAGGEALHFEGFPRQWIPIFERYGIAWSHCQPPPQPVPLASELSDDQVLALVRAAEARGQGRVLVEAWVALDPLLSDVLYRLDRRVTSTEPSGNTLSLTGWQSYGRAEVQAFDQLISYEATVSYSDTAVLLPCARTRPYDRSRTHHRIWQALAEQGVQRGRVDAIVVSSIGVVPERHWNHPVVLAYDSGVPDIWRVLRLLRAYFVRLSYRVVIDCLDFAPYSECVRILALERLIQEIRAGPQRRKRRLPRP